MTDKKISKKLSKENFIKLFEFAFDTDINEVLSTRTKAGIGGGSEFNDFYEQIIKIMNVKNFIYSIPNELNCILRFFDDKCYEKIEVPENYGIIFSLIRFSQTGYNPNNNIKKITNYLHETLGHDLFIKTSLCYFEKNKMMNENIKDILSKKNNIFSVITLDYIHPYFIENVFNAIYKNYKSTEKHILEQQVASLIAGRINNSSLSFYKKLEKIDNYIGTSRFAEQFYEFNLLNKKFMDKMKIYKIECQYNYLNKSLVSSKQVKQNKSMKI